MLPAIRILSACMLLAFVSLTAAITSYSGGDKPDPQQLDAPHDRPAVARDGPQLGREDPGPSADSTTVAPTSRSAARRGPILLPANPPYLKSAIDRDSAAPVDQPAGKPAPHDRAKAAPTRQDQVEDEQPPSKRRPEEAAGKTSASQAPEATPDETPVTPPPEPKPQLTPALAALRDRVRQTLAFHHRRAFSASENTATELMHRCLAFGCNTEVYRSGRSGKKVNGITCLCWNYPCAGYRPLGLSQGYIAARIGYGLQEQPSQLLAVLALSRVKASYPMRVGQDVRTVADLVEYEKLSCRSGTDLSLKLIGLAYYVVDDRSWKNSLGKPWSIERIVEEELARPTPSGACAGMQRLMGLSYALARRAKRGQPIEGPLLRARQFIDQYHDHALQLQNADGSWSPQSLAGRAMPGNEAPQLRCTGHVLEWLVMSLPDDRLDDPRVVRSVELVDRLLSGQRYRRGTKSLSTREISSVMHAVHALAVYDERFFKARTATRS